MAFERHLFTNALFDRVTYEAWWEAGENFRVLASSDFMTTDWSVTVTAQNMPEKLDIELDERRPSVVLVIYGEHPRGGDKIVDRVHLDLGNGAELGREGASW